MPWEKSFDIEEAVDQAAKLFGAKGYEATSLADLLAAMGINKGSFYNAFGSKRGLFIRSLLKHQLDVEKAARERISEVDDPVRAITTLFEVMIAEGDPDKSGNGNFMVNTALDLPNHDEETVKTVKRGFSLIQNFFMMQIELGQKSGVIPSSVKGDVTSRSLLALLVGQCVLSRGVFDQDERLLSGQQVLKLLEVKP
ncbi:TetR/AcrR family transcriptional regulator [Flexibacterium corallicola]|uniref:TetR/AcrR family transcriptional regulator n=1 Tax=Flexibacterium corallicola TaxID=3037259 RepID=UPI00286ED0FC|nr:TetR/AcrR family transcriptional regulator [Pseudovibrio sp. M1P-2-3]